MATTEETSLPATTDPAPKAPAQPDAAKTTPADAAAAPAAEPQPEAAAAAAEPAPPPVIPRVVIVTGASSGLGLEVSRVLGAAGHDVVMACRSEDKASRAIEKLKKENLKGSLTYMPRHLIIHKERQPSMSSLCNIEDKPCAGTLANVTTNLNNNRCQVCDKVFKWKSSLSRHKRVHTGEKPYGCLLCDRRFSESGHLQHHERTVHSSEKPYCCLLCGKVFKSSGVLNVHVRGVHNGAKPHVCKHCADCFRHRYQLNAHLLKSHNEGCTCHICGKKFSKNAYFKVHLLRHEGRKPYVCSDCPKCFCTAIELKRHQTVHSEVKLFFCYLCSKGFKQKAFFLRHLARCLAKHSC